MPRSFPYFPQLAYIEAKLSFSDIEIPRPIPLSDGRASNRSYRSGAGSKEKCVYCGRKTYRYIGNHAVCSFCDAQHRAEEERRWSPSMAI